ncbi:MAG: diacylglycerol kinase family lipid kinase [Chloroflexi bacterium]|jgi:diacylglycerol kinase (ATP)|nr:diacylglycerol kinase family protein [Anaerolineaceae bacterium]NMB91156.1 diacylglycerol kinase family lipid kinase [Chloroflexota bacterium]
MATHRIIVNPIAGHGEARQMIPEIEQELQKNHIDYELMQTQHAWHAAELAQQAVVLGCEVIVSVGGDGTFNEVLNGIMLAREAGLGSAVLGVIPVGQGNDFSFAMGIPAGVPASVRALAAGQRRTIDVGLVTGGYYPLGRYFGNGVGIGFDAIVSFLAAKNRRTKGFASYLWAVTRTISLYSKAPMVSIDVDGEVVQQRALMISLMNGRRMGGGFVMAPQSDPEDGLLDLCIVRQVPRPRIVTLVPYFLNGTQRRLRVVKMLRGRKVIVRAVQGTLPAHADGETICTEADELSIQILPKQIELIYQPEPEPVPAPPPPKKRRRWFRRKKDRQAAG